MNRLDVDGDGVSQRRHDMIGAAGVPIPGNFLAVTAKTS